MSNVIYLHQRVHQNHPVSKHQRAADAQKAIESMIEYCRQERRRKPLASAFKAFKAAMGGR